MYIKYKFFIFAIGVLGILIGMLYHPVFYIFTIFYFGYIYKNYRLKVTLIFGVLILGFFLCLQYPAITEDTIITGEIIDVDEKYIVVKHDSTKVKVYGEFSDFHMYDIVELEIAYFEIPESTNDNAFNYKNYLYSQGIMQQGYLVEVKSHTPKVTPFLILQNRIKENSSVEGFVSLFVLGIKTAEMENIYASLTELSVVHIFALSGMHIHVLKKWLMNIFKYIIPPRYLTYTIIIIIGIYMYNIPENISFLRAYLVMGIYAFGKKYITQLDALGIACVIMLLRNPFVIYHISFVFSYTLYFIVLLIGKYKYSNFLVFLSSIPIVISLQYRIQLTSLFLTTILTPLIQVLYMLSLWYVVLGGIIVPFLQIWIYVVESVIIFSNAIAIYIPFSKPTLFFISSYYLYIGYIIIKVNMKRKYYQEILKLGVLLLVFYIHTSYPLVGKVVMIDVGQGDCFLIKQPLSKGNILIDTGGLKNRDIASDTLIPYLRSEGIFSLDYVFISHDDMDHSGALSSLQQQMSIKNIIKTYQDPIQIGDIRVAMYPIETNTFDKNANSLIFKVEVNTISYLFTGDIGMEEEQKLLQTYKEINVDVLKIPHHGSKYSTSYELLYLTKPKVAFISCGKNNFYGHPHNDVLERLKRYGIHVYRTDKMGMVTITYMGGYNYIYP